MKLRIELFVILLMFVVIMLAGCSVFSIITGKADTDAYNQAEFGPVSQDSRVPFDLPPYPDPSFEGLIAQFKADVVANKGYNLNNKKRVIANSDLLWTPSFQIPDVHEIHQIPLKGYHPAFWIRFWLSPHGNKFRYRQYYPPDNLVVFLKHNRKGVPMIGRVRENISVDGIPNGLPGFTGKIFYTTKRQEKKIAALSRSSMYDSSVDYYRNVDYYRKKWMILAEKIDPLIIAKHMSQIRVYHGYVKQDIVGIEFAERAMQKHSNSAEAMYYWVICLSAEEQLTGYKRLLVKFPNAAFAHYRIAHLYFQQDKIDAALVHIQKAIQLDRFISYNKSFLAQCYAKLGKWEKAIAAYQSSVWLTAEQSMDLLNAQKQFVLFKREHP